MKKCSKCKQEKNLDLFPNLKISPDGKYSWCKECSKKQSSEYYYREYKKNPERFREMGRKWRRNNPNKVKAIQKRKQDRYRNDALFAYSKGIPKCSCCGEDEYKFLCIDHVDGGGTAHRRELVKSGSSMYLWLRKNNYPEGFQVLCHNCNLAKGFYGRCPHQN